MLIVRLLGNTLGLDFIASKYVNKTKCEINVYCNYYSSLTTTLLFTGCIAEPLAHEFFLQMSSV